MMTNFWGDFWDSRDITFGSSLQAAGSIYGGVSNYIASQTVARSIREQGAITEAEAFRTADIIREEGVKFAAKQSLQYIGSGVQMVGSALITTAQTKKYAQTEALAAEDRGRAIRHLSEQQAEAKESEGRAALIGGIIQGVGAFF
jgi:hypothetical protein